MQVNSATADSVSTHKEEKLQEHTNNDTTGGAQPANMNFVIPVVCVIVLAFVVLALFLYRKRII